jgi:hypothetical protein
LDRQEGRQGEMSAPGPLQDWVRQVSDPAFPWRSLEEECEEDPEWEGEAEGQEDLLMVDPMRGWQNRVDKVHNLR